MSRGFAQVGSTSRRPAATDHDDFRVRPDAFVDSDQSAWWSAVSAFPRAGSDGPPRAGGDPNRIDDRLAARARKTRTGRFNARIGARSSSYSFEMVIRWLQRIFERALPSSRRVAVKARIVKLNAQGRKRASHGRKRPRWRARLSMLISARSSGWVNRDGYGVTIRPLRTTRWQGTDGGAVTIGISSASLWRWKIQ
jgi:hypothetical protein